MGSHNNVDRLRQRMLDGKICVGTGIALTDPLSSEIAAEAGNDFVWIEMEHSHIDNSQLIGHIMAVRGTNAAALVRVSWNDPVILKPVVDMCPAGVIVPMIRSADEALKAVQACRYPPEGSRGFGPIRSMYGFASMEAYLEAAAEQVMVFVQIEHIDAVDDLDNIVQVPGLDGLVIGRNDLSGSMGKLGQHADPEVQAAIDKVFAAVQGTGLFVGCSVGYDLSVVDAWWPKGCHFFSIGGDTDYFAELAAEVARKVHAYD